MKKQKFKMSAIGIALVFSVALTSVSAVTAAGILQSASTTKSLHAKVDMSQITNEGGNPKEISSSASALTKEKQWYEYVNYSLEPVGAYKLSDNVRVVFYDPYDYSGALVMEIDDTVTDWSSANSLTATYETGNSMTTGLEKSTETTSAVELEQGTNISNGSTKSVSDSFTQGATNSYNVSKSLGASAAITTGWEINAGFSNEFTLGNSTSIGVEGGTPLVQGSVNNTTNIENKTIVFGNATTNFSATAEVNGNVTEDTGMDTYSDRTIGTGSEETQNITQNLSSRISSATGNSTATNKSWSTEDRSSVSKTYNASYFNDSGSPLQWKIVKYTVMMPIHYKVQYLIDGEWITTDSAYSLLTTVQGSCRSWLQNNTAYYEHWGTGEPVTWNDFWGKFFTKESLIAAYKNKLYPER